MKKLIFLFCLLVSLVSCKKEPVASFSFSGSTMVGQAISFVNESSNANEFLWDFGDNTTSTLESPSHTFDKPGSYSVKLTVVGEDGSATVSQNITIKGTTYSFKNNFGVDFPTFTSYYWNGEEIEDLINHGLLRAGSETDPVITTRSFVMFGIFVGESLFIGIDEYTLQKDKHNMFIIDKNTRLYEGKGVIIDKLEEKLNQN